MITFIWVTGHSACGKQTFIDRFESDHLDWCQRLDLAECKNPAHLVNPSLERIERSAATSDVVLIKWQCEGFATVLQLQQRRPQDKHVVLMIRRALSEHRSAFSAKWPESRFEAHQRKNVAIVEAYRPFIDTFIDIANIDGEFHVIGMTKQTDPEGLDVLKPATVDLASAITQSFHRILTNRW